MIANQCGRIVKCRLIAQARSFNNLALLHIYRSKMGDNDIKNGKYEKTFYSNDILMGCFEKTNIKNQKRIRQLVKNQRKS